MARKGKRKLSTNELSELKSESRSSRRKTADARSTPATTSRRKKMKEEKTERGEKSNYDSGKMDTPQDKSHKNDITSGSSQVDLSLGDRIELILPKEFYRDDASDTISEASEESTPNVIPETIERPPLPWADERESDSSEEEDEMNWETVAEAELEKSTPEPVSSDQVYKDVEITFEAPKSKNR